jgi:hypothetical protein
VNLRGGASQGAWLALIRTLSSGLRGVEELIDPYVFKLIRDRKPEQSKVLD